MLKKIILVFILGMHFTLAIGQAQVSDKSLFDDGVTAYKNGNYAAAQSSLIKVLRLFPNSPLQTSVKLLLGKAYFHQQNYRTALIVCESFEKNHRDSRYFADINLLKGEIYFKQGNYQKAIDEWVRVSESSRNNRLLHQAQNYIFNTLSFQLSKNEWEQIQLNTPDAPGIKTMVRLNRRYYQGELDQITPELKQFIKNSPMHPYVRFAYAILSGNDQSTGSSSRFVLLKTNDALSNPVVNALMQGMYYAKNEYETRNPGRSLSLDTVVVSPGVLSTIKTVQEEIQRNNPLAFISALGKDATAGLALASKYESFPLIVPMQGETGITEMSPEVFQLSADNETKGRSIGQYATKDLHLKTFAILAPANKYGQELAQSFEAAVLENSGEIVEHQWYYEDTDDFSRQLKAIRKKGFFIAFRDSVLAEDSTITADSISAKYAAYRNDMLFSDQNVHGKVDSSQISSTGIDGVYIVIYPDLIPYIAPQFAFHNIETTLLGNEGWNDREQLVLQQTYLDGLIYTNAGYYDRNSWNYSEFTSRFRQKIHVTPQFYHLLGYDVGKWLFKKYLPGISRREYAQKLAEKAPYKGILINIDFKENTRINSELNLVKFFSGRFYKLK